MSEETPTAQELVRRVIGDEGYQSSRHENYFAHRRESFNNVKDVNENGRESFISYNKEDINELKGIAPSAPAIGDSNKSPVFQTSSLQNAIASPSACDSRFANGSPETNDVASLRANDENDKACNSNRDPDQPPTSQPEPADLADVDDVTAEQDDDAHYNPDFYYLRHDLFDNGEKANSTRYRSVISAWKTPTCGKAGQITMRAEFHNRARDFKTIIRKYELWEHPWYQDIWATFERVRDYQYDFAIKPTIGIIKKDDRVDDKRVYVPLSFTACMLFQVRDQAPVIAMFFGAWENFIQLDGDFERRKKSNLIHVGYFRDPERLHLEEAKKAERANPNAFKSNRL